MITQCSICQWSFATKELALRHDCGEYNKVRQLEAALLVSGERVRRLEQALTTVLASAYPHPVEHPTMTAAWAVGRAALSEPSQGITDSEDKQIADAFRRFAYEYNLTSRDGGSYPRTESAFEDMFEVAFKTFNAAILATRETQSKGDV